MSNVKLIKVTDAKLLKELASASAFTIEGAGGDLNEWMEGLNGEMTKLNIGNVNTFYTFKGKLMNDTYALTGKNKYQDALTFLCFRLDGLDVGKLAIFKMQFGARWLDDIVDNNVRREEETYV